MSEMWGTLGKRHIHPILEIVNRDTHENGRPTMLGNERSTAANEPTRHLLATGSTRRLLAIGSIRHLLVSGVIQRLLATGVTRMPVIGIVVGADQRV
jgi:hypothetical protein